jgi:hypothetical protein
MHEFQAGLIFYECVPIYCEASQACDLLFFHESKGSEKLESMPDCPFFVCSLMTGNRERSDFSSSKRLIFHFPPLDSLSKHIRTTKTRPRRNDMPQGRKILRPCIAATSGAYIQNNVCRHMEDIRFPCPWLMKKYRNRLARFSNGSSEYCRMSG